MPTAALRSDVSGSRREVLVRVSYSWTVRVELSWGSVKDQLSLYEDDVAGVAVNTAYIVGFSGHH